MSRICDLESGRKYLVSIVSQMKMENHEAEEGGDARIR